MPVGHFHAEHERTHGDKADLRELESRILGRIAIMLIAGIGLLAVLIVLMRPGA